MSPDEQPNIVLILTDNHSFDQLGCYGNPNMDTPHLDQLAEHGVRFTDFYAAAPVCTPSRSGLLTGRYPHRNGLFENIRNNMTDYGHEYTELEYTLSPEMTQGLDLREITIGEALRQGGYRTGIVGKWDSGRAYPWLPLQRGFDVFYGFCNTGVDYWTHERYGIPSLFRGNRRVREEGYKTTLFANEAVRFIEDSREHPFFLYTAFHIPQGGANLDGGGLQVPEEYLRIFDEPPESDSVRRRAMIKCLDDSVGKVLETLDQQGLRDNTLVVFASDGGGRRPDQMRGSHGDMYEGNLRVPCIARWPGQIPEGVVSDAFFTGLDLFPTILAAAGIVPPSKLELDGMNMLPVLQNNTDSPRSEFVWESRGSRAVRSGPWKWVVNAGPEARYPTTEELPDPDVEGELFDLEEDIGERNNLANQHPEVERRLRRRWRTWMQEMANAPARGPFSKAYFDILGFGDGSYRL